MAQMERGEKSNYAQELVVKITADVDEAVAGLKRLQRVARETVKELREVENIAKKPQQYAWRKDGDHILFYDWNDNSVLLRTTDILKEFSAQELIDELARRDDVELFDIGYGDRYEVCHYFDEEYVAKGDPFHSSYFSFGPAKVIVVKGECE